MAMLRHVQALLTEARWKTTTPKQRLQSAGGSVPGTNVITDGESSLDETMHRRAGSSRATASHSDGITFSTRFRILG